MILAAGLSKRLRPHTDDRPKCLLTAGGKTLLARQIDQLGRCGVRHIYVVTGYCADKVAAARPAGEGVSCVYNPDYAASNNAFSLALALERVQGDFIYTMADCIFGEEVLARVIGHDADLAIAAECLPGRIGDDDVKVSVNDGRVVRIGKNIGRAPAHGRFAGAVKAGGKAGGLLRAELARCLAASYLLPRPRGQDMSHGCRIIL